MTPEEKQEAWIRRNEKDALFLAPIVLCVGFIGLRLNAVIDWSWWWVLSPLLVPIGLVLTNTVFHLIAVSRSRPR